MERARRHSSTRVAADEPDLTAQARRYSDTPLVCDKCGRTADRSIAGGRDGHSQLCPGCAAERDERRSKSANLLWFRVLDEVAGHGGAFGPKIAEFVSAMRRAEATGTDLGHLPARLVQAAYTAPASPTHIMPRVIAEAEAVFRAISHAASSGGDRTGNPEVDAVIDAFLDEPCGDWTTSRTLIRDLTPEEAAGNCQSIAEQFVEFAKAHGLQRVYATDTDMEEMGYKTHGAPHGDILDDDGNVVPGFYFTHTVNEIYMPGINFPYTVDFTAKQYGYDTLVKVTASRTAARADLPLAEPGTVVTAADDYPELEDILWTRPDHVEAMSVDVRQVSLGSKTAAKDPAKTAYNAGWAAFERGSWGAVERADVRGAPIEWYMGFYDADAGREKYHAFNNPESEFYVFNHPELKTGTTIDDLMKNPKNNWWFKHVTGPRLKRINEALPPGYKVNDIEQVMGDDNWCRFREDSNCYYPKELDAQATEVAGYDVWFPQLRGHCARHLDRDQKECPIAEPGPKSGAPNWKPKLTKSWEQGGQRVGAVQVSVRKRASLSAPIYRALRGVMIPFDPDKDGSISGKAVVERALVELRAEGYGPEKPGSWWFVHPGGGELDGAKFWANSFGKYMGKRGDKALVGFIYEATFADPQQQIGVDSYIPGVPINITAIHVTNSDNQWERIPFAMATTAAKYTLDAEKDGQYFEDHGLTEEQVAAARANADRLGITILNVTEEVDVSVDDLAPFRGKEAKWTDVRDKAVRIRRDGGVRILSNTGQTVTAEVHGDHGIYVSSITRVPGTKQRGMWFCGCKWTQYVWARSQPYKRFEGRPCSHSMALLYEIQSHELRGGEMTRRSEIPFGEKVWEQPEAPSWDIGPGKAQERWFENLEFESSVDDGSAKLALGNIGDSLRVANVDHSIIAVLDEALNDGIESVAMSKPFPAKVHGLDVIVIVDGGVPMVGGDQPVDATEVIYPTWDEIAGLIFVSSKTATSDEGSSWEVHDRSGGTESQSFDSIEEARRYKDKIESEDDSEGEDGEVELEVIHLGSLTKEAGKRGVMVALSPTRQVCERLSALAAEAGFTAEDPAQIHLTLAYCGHTDEIDRDAFLGAVRAFAAQQRPFQGSINGIGMFVNGDENALWAAADIGGLAAARTALTEFLLVAGTPAKTEHDFTPHITIAYADEPIMMLPDMSKIVGTELKFTTLVAAYGGEWVHLDLVSDSGETVAIEKVASFEERLGNCYQLAYQYVKRTPGSKLVHGSIGGPNASASEDGAPKVAHAWAINPDGSIYEPISEESMPEHYFKDLFDGVPIKVYEREEAMIALLKNNHYGPWDGPAKESAKKKHKKQPTLHLLHDDDEIALRKIREHHGIDKEAFVADDTAFGRAGLHKIVTEHGFSVNSHFDSAPTTGFMVSAAKTEEEVLPLEELTAEHIAAYRKREAEALKKKDTYLGAWVSDGKVYLDLSCRFTDREEAMKVARDNEQIAIYELATGKSIETEKLAKAASNSEFWDIDQSVLDTVDAAESLWQDRVEREFQEHEGPMSDREHSLLHQTKPNPDASFDPVSYYEMLTDEHRHHHGAVGNFRLRYTVPQRPQDMVDGTPREFYMYKSCRQGRYGLDWSICTEDFQARHWATRAGAEQFIINNRLGDYFEVQEVPSEGIETTAQIDEDEGRRAVEEECAKGNFGYAGLIIKALDSGRVLMTQRTPYHNDDEETVGKWEWPGGAVDEGETAIEGAFREFTEETGLTLPEGWNITGCQAEGDYLAIHVVVPHESWTTDAELLTRETMGIGWFDQEHVEDTTLARPEVQEADWEMIAEASLVEAEAEAILLDEPEPALPVAYGADDGINGTVVASMPGPDDPFVPGDPRLAHLAPTPGEAGADNDDIAAAAGEFLKQALKTFSPAEQKQLIDEGADEHLGASNTDRLDVSGTFYELMEEDSDELAFW